MYSPRYWLFEKCRFWNVPVNGKNKNERRNRSSKSKRADEAAQQTTYELGKEIENETKQT